MRNSMFAVAVQAALLLAALTAAQALSGGQAATVPLVNATHSNSSNATRSNISNAMNSSRTYLNVSRVQPRSPCHVHHKGEWSLQAMQHYLHQVAMDVYNKRASETYSEDMVQRWDGISGHVCPPAVPRYSDCSSMVTWVYWTLFGQGGDFMNGENWKGGYTGSLDQFGRQVPANVNDLQVGDLCFYYTPMHHVAIYVGGGMVVSHGMDPVGYYAWDYAPVDFCRRYL